MDNIVEQTDLEQEPDTWSIMENIVDQIDLEHQRGRYIHGEYRRSN